MVSEFTSSSALLALQRTTHSTLHLLSSELTELELTTAEINALANLADGRSRTVSDLAAAAGSRPTTLTNVLDRLERRGHLVRGPHPSDRRAVLLTLTERGREAADTIRRAFTALEHQALGHLSSAELTAFRAALQALTETK